MNDNMQTFENAMQQLECILAKISSDETTLDDSIAMYAKAAELISICGAKLSKAKVQLDEIDAQYAMPEQISLMYTGDI